MKWVLRPSWGMLASGGVSLGLVAGAGASASYAAGAYAASQLVNNYAPPFVLACYEVMFGIAYITVVRFQEVTGVGKMSAPGLRWSLLAGVGLACGIGFFYSALGRAPLSVAAPILGVSPLVAYLFVRILLRDVERVTPRILLGAILVVSGVALIGVNNA